MQDIGIGRFVENLQDFFEGLPQSVFARISSNTEAHEE